MVISNLPPVFKDFSIGYDSDGTGKLSNNSIVLNPVSDNQKIQKEQTKKHTFAKISAGVILAGVAFVSLVPLIRHNKFPQVNPNLASGAGNSSKFKKNFIKFSDGLEIRRDLAIEYIKTRFIKLKELIRKNFFSYNQQELEKHSPIKDFPKVFVSSVIHEINDFMNFCHKISHKIEIDYTNYTKSL